METWKVGDWVKCGCAAAGGCKFRGVVVLAIPRRAVKIFGHYAGSRVWDEINISPGLPHTPTPYERRRVVEEIIAGRLQV